MIKPGAADLQIMELLRNSGELQATRDIRLQIMLCH